MQVFHKLEDVPANFGPSLVSVGNFDGVHRAHAHVLGLIVDRAKLTGAKSVAVTFEPHPLTDEVISEILGLVESYRDRVDVRAIAPTVQWRSSASTLTTAGEGPDASFLAV